MDSSLPTSTTEPESTIYRASVVYEGDMVIAEFRATVEGLAVEPSVVKFRLVEYADGPFLQVVLDEVVPAASAFFWTVTIDGRFGGKSSAHPGGTQGTRLAAEQYERGVTVVFAATNEADSVIQSSGEVIVSR